MTKDYIEGKDPYAEPSGVLRNKLGIKDTQHLNKAEGLMVGLRLASMRHDPIHGNFDAKHLNAIHKALFTDVYEWAGNYRSVDIVKGSTYFAHYAHIPREADKLFKKLNDQNHLKGLDKTAFAARAGEFFSDLNILHPYREGNGRTSRAFVSELARNAGFWLEIEGIGKAAMTEASIAGFYGDSKPMGRLLEMNLRKVHEGPSLGFQKQTPSVQASLELIKEAQQLRSRGDNKAAEKLTATALRLASDIGKSGRYQENPFGEKEARDLHEQFQRGTVEREKALQITRKLGKDSPDF